MNEAVSHSGAWGAAAIMVVIASWILYRHLAPKTWREWAGAGLVQAFIIALYAETYGFPLTIYPTMFSVALFPVILLVYGLLARREEQRVLEVFGDEFRAYQQRVPMFIPQARKWGQFVLRSSTSEPSKP